MSSMYQFIPMVLAAGLVVTAAAASDKITDAEQGFRTFLESFREGTERFINGDNKLWKANASQTGDAVIMGAWGAYEKGWPEVSARYDWAARRFVNGEARLDVEYLASSVSGDLAYTVAIERSKVRLAGQATIAPMALRVTHVFRRENGDWKLVLRHADPLMKKTAPEATLLK